MTVRELIKSSLRLIGVIAAGENPSADEASDALQTLNDLLDTWYIEKLLVFEKIREVFTLTPGQGSYTIGPIAVEPLVNFNTSRPVQILNASILTTTNPKAELPIEIATDDEWAKVSIKDLQSTIPKVLYQLGNAPIDTLYLYPVPSEARELVIYSMKQLTSYTSLNDVVQLPPGYVRAVKYNLALELASEYGKTASPFVELTASKSISKIKRLNSDSYKMKSDAFGISSGGRVFNWMTGE